MLKSASMSSTIQLGPDPKKWPEPYKSRYAQRLKNAQQKQIQLPPPQPGPQTEFLNCKADIAIFGGSAGSGKTYGLLVEPLRHIPNKDFGAVIFRRTSTQIRNEGGLWDESCTIYPKFKATPRETVLDWIFPSGAKVKFAHLQYETDVIDWLGAQIPFIGWDQLENFTEQQFFYMLSRNRSLCGVKPYVRATCNPVPEDDEIGGWLHRLIQWWINPETGLPIEERSGVIRWLVRVSDELHWGDSPDGLRELFPGCEPKSFTFIPARLTDNQILMQKDPGYLANLMALPLVDRERLLGGNWNIKASAGKVFNRAWFEIVDAVPSGGETVRAWDLAASEKKMVPPKNKHKDPDYTASCKMRKVDGVYYVMDATAERLGPTEADNRMKALASQDGIGCKVRWEEEGGASGKRDSAHLVKLLAGYDCKGIRPEGDKIVRAKPTAAQAEAGNVKLLRAPWNERWLNHMHGQPDLAHDDEMDAASTAFNSFTGRKKVLYA